MRLGNEAKPLADFENTVIFTAGAGYMLCNAFNADSAGGCLSFFAASAYCMLELSGLIHRRFVPKG